MDNKGDFMKLVSIPKEKYNDYRLDVMFDCYKWDPQFLDNNTIAEYALVISEENLYFTVFSIF